MNRTECYLAPVFDNQKLSYGVTVKFTRRNRKGVQMFTVVGKIVRNNGDTLYIETPDKDFPIMITAKSVYYGKNHLTILK